MREFPNNQVDLQELVLTLSAQLSNSEKEKQIFIEKYTLTEKENKLLLIKISELEEIIRLLKANKFGKSSEKVKNKRYDPEDESKDSNVTLGIQKNNAEDQTKVEPKAKKRSGRQKIP